MVMSSLDVEARYAAARSVGVTEHRVLWTAMSSFTAHLHRLRRSVDELGCGRDLELLLTELSSFCARLGGTPVHPREAGSESLIEGLTRLFCSGTDSAHAHLIELLEQSVRDLESHPHPAASVLEDVVSRYGCETPGGEPVVYLAARRDEREALAGWLLEAELSGDVRTPTELKTARVREALILIGPPARYYLSAWRGREQAGRAGNWLVTAAPAQRVHVVTWPGHPPFEIGSLVPGEHGPDLEREVRPLATIDLTEPEPQVWTPPSTNRRKVAARMWDGDPSKVEATVVHLAGGGVTYYSDLTGPTPQAVRWDGRGVELTPVPVRSIRPGLALLFRTGSVGSEELERRAREHLERNRGPGSYSRALAAKQELKEAWRRYPGGVDALRADLKSPLKGKQYADHVARRLGFDDYIAPEKRGAHEALRQVLGLPPDDSKSQLIRALRASMRHAGALIVEDLRQKLLESRDWIDDLESSGYTGFDGGPGLGQMTICVAVEVDAEPSQVGTSRLGLLDLQLPPSRSGLSNE